MKEEQVTEALSQHKDLINKVADMMKGLSLNEAMIVLVQAQEKIKDFRLS